MLKPLKYGIYLCTIVMVLAFAGCSLAQSRPIQAEKGILDLSGWDQNQGANVKLIGEWNFYWMKLLSFSDLQRENPDLLAFVPSTWNRYQVQGKNLPGEGYATYSLHVITSLPAGTKLGLRVLSFSSAYNMYINEKLVGKNGKVATKASNEIGEYKPQEIYFSIPASDFYIIVQVSNFQYARGGLWDQIIIGNPERIGRLNDAMLGNETFLLGVLAIIAMSFLMIFFLLRELRYSLYFACFCIVFAVAMDMVGQLILLRFFPTLSLKLVIFIWYSSYVWVLLFIMLYMHELFKSRFSTFIVKTYLGIAAVFQMIFIFTPSTFYTKPGDILDIFVISGALCSVAIIAIGIKKGQKDGWLNIASMIVVLVAYIHDCLYWMYILPNSFEMLYDGLFLFIFLQMIVQAKRIREFFEQRTAAQLSFLQAQIKPHFLYNAINTFISISRYDVEKARELLINFSYYLRNRFDFKVLGQTVSLKNEIEMAQAYINIEKARFEERLEVNFDVCDDLEVKVPILMLEPVIENAVNHGILPKPDGGRIDVSIKREGKLLIFSVKDNGAGMNRQKINDILKLQSGVGLANIDSRLKKLYGRGVNIDSSPETGTEVTWRIPINQNGGE